ncbi:hypothetical protein M427DRAFT_34884 [Gonapodya prolifera JEL478]|uniref:VIT domain-containing protein n=1 Tax=Gonapodya prolifera (strain JEL478) TaxID=1344416 RepID=A0A139A6B9_GONPJ|nr:hypothetical protein M427DRAFT_34884 [Gonapodya prolifera JEL478]|eukprot:KXS12337.1 hypothetical protein M427DRAFT_34884 [Gonapodya prolifera JEL478]
MAEPGLYIHVAVVDCLASVTLSQTYFNDSEKNVEAVYKFPVYESTAVYVFEAEIDGVVIRGVCKEREKAAQEYNKAIQSGDRAFLFEEQKADDIRREHTFSKARPNSHMATFEPPEGTNLMPGGTTYSSEANYDRCWKKTLTDERFGAAVSHLLVNRFARAGMGTDEFVGSAERMEGKVMKLLKAGVKRFLRSLKVKWFPQGTECGFGMLVPPSEGQLGPQPVKKSLFDDDELGQESPQATVIKRPLLQPAPFNAPPLYAGTRYIAFAILDQSLPDPALVTVTAQGPDGPLELEVAIRDNTFGGSDSLAAHRMAAKKLVQDLEEGTTFWHDAESSKSSAREAVESERAGRHCTCERDV